jgi:hypothetical protein
MDALDTGVLLKASDHSCECGEEATTWLMRRRHSDGWAFMTPLCDACGEARSQRSAMRPENN